MSTPVPTPSAAMTPSTPITPESVVAFLEEFERLSERKDFDLIRDLVDEHAIFRFNDGDFVGRPAIEAAFERTWRGDPTVRASRFRISNIVVLTTDRTTAAATYDWTWEGTHAEATFTIHGRGTRVLRTEGGRFRIVHEHLSRMPPVR